MAHGEPHKHSPLSAKNGWELLHSLLVTSESSSPPLTNDTTPHQRHHPPLDEKPPIPGPRHNGIAESVDKRPLNQEKLRERHKRFSGMGPLHSPDATSKRLSEHGRKGERPEGREHRW